MTILQAFGLEEGTTVPQEAVDPIIIYPKKDKDNISLEHKALIELIAEMNIPYTQLESPAWENFIHTLNPGFIIPMKDFLRNLILEHSSNLLHQGIQDLQNHTCGLAIDGATLISLHIYGFVLVDHCGLRLAGFKHVDDQKGKTLAIAISDTIKQCSKHGISISSIVSDNAASLKCAITNADDNNSFTLKALIGEEVLRCACAAHTSQLSIKDLIDELPFMQEFMSNVITLLKFMSDKSADFKQ